jgi:MFS family permease
LLPTAARKLTESHGPQAHLDLRGLALVSAGALGITWGLVRANTVGWISLEVLSTLAAGVLLIGAFIAWERRAAQPMIPPTLFKAREFTAANGVSFFMYAGLFGALFLMSQLLQTGLGYSPIQAGLRLLPWTVPPMIIAPLAGTLADRCGNRPFMILGLALQTAGYAWVANIAHAGMGYLELGVAFTVSGIGTSFCFPTVANAIMGSVPLEQAGVASGTNSTLRELGGVCGVAILASVFASHGGYHTAEAFIHGFDPAIWVAVGLSTIGIIAATLTGASRQPRPAGGLEPQLMTAA